MTKLFKNEEKVYKGYWWRPQYPEKKVAGVLTFNGDNILLELIGTLYNDITEQFSTDKEDLIFGIDSNAKEITLIICYKFFSYTFSSEFPIERYNCKRMVYDKHLGGMDDKSIYSANFFFPELSYWAPPSAIYHFFNLEGNNSINFSFENKVIERVAINTNSILEIIGGVNFKSGDNVLSPEISQKTWIKIEYNEAVSLSHIESDMRKLSSFLSLAFMTDVQCSRLFLTSPDEVQELENGEKHYFPIDIYWPKQCYIRDNSRRNHIFCLNDIKGNFDLILQKWMNCNDDMRPILNHLVNSLKKKNVFSSVDFLVVIQAIEGFWWRFRDSEYHKRNNIESRHQTKLHSILRELLNEYGRFKVVKDLNLNIDAVVDSRHFYSHFFPNEQKKDVKYGVELYNLTMELRKLLLCLVLTEISFTDEQVENACQKM